MFGRKVRWGRLGVRLLLAAWGLGTILALVGESFPVEHREPITVRVLNGKNGLPLAGARLTLIAGYTGRDLEQKLWRDEVVTDASGEARLPLLLANFPFLVVRVAKARMCQETSHGEMYGIERIRSVGQNAPNHCGASAVAETPRVLVVFARVAGKAEAIPPAAAIEARLDYAEGADVEMGTEANELNRNAAQTGHRLEVEAGWALASVAASVGAGEVEAGPEWATSRTRNEIEALMAHRSGDWQPATKAVEGTGDSAGSYESMCQPED